MPRRRNKKVELPPREAEIACLSHDGHGVAILEGKKTLIHGALVKERVKFSYRSQYARYDEGIVEAVLSESSDRVVPGCAYFGQCGACDLQHMAQSAQLRHKQSQVLAKLQQEAGCEPNELLEPIVGNSHYGYRRKARLGVRYVAKKQRVLIGFRERSGRYLTDMKTCAVLHPSLSNKLDDLSELIGSLESFQTIPQVEAVVADNQVALCFRTLLPLSKNDRECLIAYSTAENVVIYLQPGSEQSIELLAPASLPRPLYYKHPKHNVQLEFAIHHFIQINREVNEKIVNQVVDWLKPYQQGRVLDLFSGIGNFSLPIARYTKEVIAVEGSRVMVNQLRHNAKINQLDNVCAFTQDLTESIENASWADLHFDACVLDPSRAGAGRVMQWLLDKSIKTIIYVSCNAESFAQDVAILAQGDYQLTKLAVADMFPHTTHIETLALFEKK